MIPIGCLYNRYCIVALSIDVHADWLALSYAVWCVCMHIASLPLLRLRHHSSSFLVQGVLDLWSLGSKYNGFVESEYGGLRDVRDQRAKVPFRDFDALDSDDQ